MTRRRDGTPARFSPERWRFAQSSGEWPGERRILPRALGVLTVAVGMRPPAEEGGPLFGTGPRFGRGPVVGTRRDGVWVGRARRLEALSEGGGMSDEEAGLAGGAMDAGFGGGAIDMAGGAMDMDGDGADALWAEFSAGNEGGGRLSSSSSSSELS